MTQVGGPAAGVTGRRLRVLLISPVRGVDPLSGDVTYTEQLLSSPPPGVTYTTYVDAIEAGTLVECGTRRAVRTAPLRDKPRQYAIAAWRKVEALVRRTGAVYREPLRHFEVPTDAFDLVHVHVFHHRFLGAHPPVLMSAAGPLEWVYADAWGWSAGRVAVAEQFDRLAGLLWDATMCGVRPGLATRFVVFSRDFKAWLTDRGWPAEAIDVVPNYLDFTPEGRASTSAPSRLGFVAKDFDAKGGAVLLEAFSMLRDRHPQLELIIVGSPRRFPDDELSAKGITWAPFVERQELLSRILPSIDILVYPSLFDGLPYGPMEALASGIPCVVSDYRALPELVGLDAGRVSRVGDADSVVAAVEELLDPVVWKCASDSAVAYFQEHFSAESQAVKLGAVYRNTVADVGRRPAASRSGHHGLRQQGRDVR
ncbi:MAG: glycosyltransferase family 4 protein [Propionicimonas sp.]